MNESESLIPSNEVAVTVADVQGFEVEVKDGLVHLPSRDVLFALEGKSVPARDFWNPVAGFTSLDAHFNAYVDEFSSLGNIEEEMPSVPAKYQAVADVTVEGDTTVVDIISSWPVYAALANQNTQLAVGEELFTLIHDGIIIIPLSDMEEYGSKPNSHPAAVEHSFNTQTIATTVSKREIGGCDNWWGPRRKGKRRVRGKLKMSTNLIGTVRTRARTQCDRMNWFRTYFPERADRIEVNATLEFDSGGGENVIAIDNDVTHVEETFTNTGCITAFFGGGIHEATDFGDTRSCFSQPQFTCP